MKQGGILSELAAIETVVEICKDKKEKALSISELNLTTPFFTKAQQSAEKLSSFVFENIVSEDVKQKKLAKLICERFNEMLPELVNVRLQGFYCSTDYINNTIINICHHLNNTIKSIDIFKESNLDDNNHAQEGIQNPSKQTDDEKDKTIAELRAEVNRLQEETDTSYEEFTSIPVHQKVQLELLMKFIEKEIPDFEKKYGQKAKVASLLSIVTGLSTQICKNYVTYRNLNKETHEEEIENANRLLKALNISFKL
jgi:hypothetical protein